MFVCYRTGNRVAIAPLFSIKASTNVFGIAKAISWHPSEAFKKKGWLGGNWVHFSRTHTRHRAAGAAATRRYRLCGAQCAVHRHLIIPAHRPFWIKFRQTVASDSDSLKSYQSSRSQQFICSIRLRRFLAPHDWEQSRHLGCQDNAFVLNSLPIYLSHRSKIKYLHIDTSLSWLTIAFWGA